MTQAYIIDTETTGLIDPVEVISLATMPVTNDLRRLDTLSHGEVIASATKLTVEEFFKPTKAIEWGALATHGILPSDLQGYKPAAEAKLPVDCTCIIGHNVDYDWKALGKPSVKRICTQAMARACWPELDSHKLAALIYYVKGATPATRELLKSAHGATVDVGLVAMLLPVLLDEFKAANVDALYAASEDARIPKIMAFGKFKGRPVSDVDNGWIGWYRRQDDPDPYLLEAFRRCGR